MKILKIIHGFPPECTGGTESYVLRVAQELVQKGHEVEILSGSMQGSGVDKDRAEVVHAVVSGLPVHRLHRSGLYVDNWEKSLAPEVAPKVRAILQDFAPDLVHVHHWVRLTRNLIEICHDAGVPAIATLHDVLAVHPVGFRITKESREGPRFGDPSQDRLEPILSGHLASEDELRAEYELHCEDLSNELHLARRLIVPSIAHRDLISSFDPGLRGRLRVLPHGLICPIAPQTRAERLYPHGGPLRIGHWGHLSRLKGLDLLLEAVRRLDDPRRVHLDLFGTLVYPDEREGLLALAEGLDVTWHGPFQPADLARVPMDLSVFPTRCHESYGFVIDEAVQLGLPVLGPDCAAFGERLRQSGGLFVPEDAGSLAARLTQILEDPTELDRIAAHPPRLLPMSEHLQGLLQIYGEVKSSRAALPLTGPLLRERRAAVRSYQLERQKRTQGHALARLTSLENDLAIAQKTMAEMDYYHREKDKVIKALQDRAAFTSEDSEKTARLEGEIARARADLAAAEGRATAARVQVVKTERSLESERRERDELARLSAGNDAQNATLKAEIAAAEERLSQALAGLEARVEAARVEARARVMAAYKERDTEREALRRELDALRRSGPQNIDPRILELLAPEKAQQENAADKNLVRALEELTALELEGSEDAQDLVRQIPAAIERVASAALARIESLEPPLRHQMASRIAEGRDRVGESLSRMRDRLRGLLAEAEDAHRHGSWQSGWLHHFGEALDQLVQNLGRMLRREALRKLPPKDGRLKILYLVHQFLPRHVAGTEIYTHRLAKELSARHDVVILSAESDPQRARFEVSRRSYDGLPVWQMVHNYRWHDFRDTYDCPEADSVFRRVLREEAPDILHVQHLHYFSANCITIAKMQGIPVVYTLHDYGLLCPNDGQLRKPDGTLCDAAPGRLCASCIRHPIDLSAPAPLLPRGLHPMMDALLSPLVTRELRRRRAGGDFASEAAEASFERQDYLRRVLEDVDLFLSPSRFLADRMIAAGLIEPARITVSDNGFDLSPFVGLQRKPAPGELRIGYVGTIAPHKGVHVLVEAMNRIADPRIKCVIWGDMSPFAQYSESLRQQNHNAKTLFMGPFPPASLTSVLAELDVLIVPSLWYENSPLTVHEAALAGIPVFASDLGGLAEYVQEDVTGKRFPMGDAEALARLIQEAIDRPMSRFDPAACLVKPIAKDALEMEARYLNLCERAALIR